MPLSKFDPLEPRLLLAGDVQVTLSGSEVTLAGDDDANELQVFTRTNAGAVELVVRGAAGTTVIGGGADFVVTNAGAVTSLTIDLGRGNDALDVAGLSGLGGGASGLLRIAGGKGDDRISVADADLPRFFVNVAGGTFEPEPLLPEPAGNRDGDDIVSLGVRTGTFHVAGVGIVDFGGSNAFYLSNLAASDGIVVDTHSWDLAPEPGEVIVTDDGSYENVLSIRNVVAGGRSDLRFMSFSQDTVTIKGSVFETAFVWTYFGDDTTEVTGCSFEYLSLLGSDGADRTTVRQTGVTGRLQLADGYVSPPGVEGEGDFFGLYDVYAPVIVVSSEDGEGNDTLLMDNVVVTSTSQGLLEVKLGVGDDLIYMTNSSSYGAGPSLHFDLGAGDDAIGLNRVAFSLGQLAYQGGTGDDQFSVGNGSSFLEMNVGDGGGTNGFYLTDTTSVEGISLSASDALSNMFYMARVAVSDGHLVVTGGRGADTIMMLDGCVVRSDDHYESFALFGGEGNNTIVISDARIRNPDHVIVSVGDGSDVVSITDSTIETGVIQIRGNGGVNLLSDSRNTFAGTPVITGFTPIDL